MNWHDTHPAPALTDPISALTDDNLLAPMLPGIHDGSWDNWLIIVRGLYGLPMTPEQAAIWRELTDRTPPNDPMRAAFILAGRRGGKTQMAAALTLYETALRDWSKVRSVGERIVGAIVAPDRRQAGQSLRFISGGLEASPMLRALVVREIGESIELANGTEVAVMTASHRSIRGRSFASLIADELCHWHFEGASPDSEIISAASPALSLTNGLLLGISTPHKRDGLMFRRYRKYWGVDDAATLIVQAPSRTLNPRLPQSVVDDAIEEDPASGQSEFNAVWRDDLASFIDLATVEAAVEPSVKERPPQAALKFIAFADVSGGRNDSTAWAIAHQEKDGRVVLDHVSEVKAPHDPKTAIGDCVETLKRYGLHEITGDKYAAEFVVGAFKEHGITYHNSTLTRSEIYLDCLPRLTSGNVELLDNTRLINQLTSLERRTRSGGRDSVDHPRGGSDDVINAGLGAVATAATGVKIDYAALL